MHTAASTLLGRQSELAALLTSLHGRAPVVAMLHGPAGIGKSSLVRAAAARWEGRVLSAWADPHVPAPMGMLREAVGAEVAGWRTVPHELAGDADAVGAFLWGEPAGQERMLRAVLALLRHLAGDRTLLLVLEDLQWADAGSVTAVRRVVRTGGLPVAVLGTYRTDEAGATLFPLLADLRRDPRAAVVELAGLSRRDVQDLVTARTRRRLSTRDAAMLHERTAGNPLFVEELVAGLRDGDIDDLGTRSLPPSAADAVLARFAELAADDVRVAEAATIAQPIDFTLLEALVGRDPTGSLRRLVDARLLVEVTDDRFAFRHDLIREAVASRMIGRERRALHDRAFTALAAAPDPDDARLARHAALAGRDDDLVRHALRGAEERLRQGFPLEALTLAEQAAATGAGNPRLWLVAALAARNLGFGRDGLRWAQEAVERMQAAGNGPGVVHAHLLLAELHAAAGRLQERDAALDRAVAVAPDPASQARCAAAAARMALLDERFDEAVRWADHALTLGEGAGCDDVRPAALVTKGSALSLSGECRDQGASWLEEGRALALRQGDAFTASRALLNGLAAELLGDDTERVWAAFTEARAYANRHGLDSVGGNITRVGADLAVSQGDQERAWSLLRERLAVEVDAVEEPTIAAKVGLLALERADDATAGELLRRYLPEAERVEQHWTRTYLRLLAVAHAARTGGPVAVTLDDYRQAVTASEHALRAPRASLAARWALIGGADVPVVRGFLDATLAEVAPAPSWWRAQLEAALAAAEGHDEQVLAVEVRYGGREPQWDADLLYHKAVAAERTGRRELARDLTERALVLLRRWPGWRRAALEDLCDRLRQPELCTPREREVLALVAAAHSNQQIATRLGISPRTVAVHVSNLLRKTGFASRLELAAWALREGRNGPPPA